MFCTGVVAMKIYHGYVVMFLLLVHSLSARLSAGLNYDFASHAAQQGDWERAQKSLSSLLIDSPDRADLLYDLGIVFCKNGDLQQACTYFSHAAACEGVSDELCERAYFNAGNTWVMLDELENAIEQYEKVLAINPANKFAQHNLDKVKEMLKQKQEEQEEQKQKEENQQPGTQQDEQNNQNNARKGNKETSHDEQEKNNQQEQNNQSRDTQSDNGNQNRKSASPDNGLPNESSQDCDEKDEQRQQTERGADGKEREQKGSKQNRRNQRDCTNDKDQRYRNNETNDKSKKQPHNKQYNNTENHNFTSAQQDIPTSSPDIHSQNKHQEQKKQDIMEKQLKSDNTTDQNSPGTMNPQDQWITAILEKQEEKDKQVNKKIMKAKIQRECAGKYGQNCW